MKRYAERLKVSKYVRFLGIRQDIQQILSFTDIFLLTSLWEGLPLTLLEAMSMSIPVISSEVNGTSELIKNGTNGYLIQPKDIKNFVDKLNYLIENPIFRNLMGENARKIAEERYGIDLMIKKTYDLYYKVFR